MITVWTQSEEEGSSVMYLEPDISGARQFIAHGTCSTITASYVLQYLSSIELYVICSLDYNYLLRY